MTKPVKLAAFHDHYQQGFADGEERERERILKIIETEVWEVIGDDCYRTYDSEASIARLKALILDESKGVKSS